MAAAAVSDLLAVHTTEGWACKKHPKVGNNTGFQGVPVRGHLQGKASRQSLGLTPPLLAWGTTSRWVRLTLQAPVSTPQHLHPGERLPSARLQGCKAVFLLHVEEEEKKERLANLAGLPRPSPLASPACPLLAWISKRTVWRQRGQ